MPTLLARPLLGLACVASLSLGQSVWPGKELCGWLCRGCVSSCSPGGWSDMWTAWPAQQVPSPAPGGQHSCVERGSASAYCQNAWEGRRPQW